MPVGGSGAADIPREWRRKVLVSARMRSPAGWGEARILNVSSRGMMIRTVHPAHAGSLIELRRGDQVIFARVVWQSGTRAGLRSDSILPVTDLMCMSEKVGDPPALWSPAGPATRGRAVCIDQAAVAYRSRVMQFAAITAIAAIVAIGLGSMAVEVLGTPLKQMQLALGS